MGQNFYSLLKYGNVGDLTQLPMNDFAMFYSSKSQFREKYSVLAIEKFPVLY